MSKIIEYINLMYSIDRANYDSMPMAIEELTVLVNEYIVENWEPVGNIVITDRFVIQTMIRRNSDKPASLYECWKY